MAAFPFEALAAVGAALDALPRIARQRADNQRLRVAPDSDVLSRLGRPLQYSSSLASYMDVHDALVDSFDLPRVLNPRTHLLIVTHEPMRANLSGPGIRVLEIARALGRDVAVTVASPAAAEMRDDRVTFAAYAYDQPSALKRIAEQADVLLVQGFTLARCPFLTALDLPIVVDLYCPFTLEHLEMTRASKGDIADAAGVLAVQNDQLRHGDFFLCASEQQRDFWLGALHTAGRLNPQTYADDPTLRRLIDVVPFGLPSEAVEEAAARGSRPRALKGVVSGIAPNDRVLLWGGSVLDWQDPQTLVRAVALLASERDDVKLFFMGTRHPNPDVRPMRAVEESRALGRELGLLDRFVFFNDWVPYADRAGYLLDADLGLSTHRDHLETRFAFRTRMLDYIWAGLPIVCTTGDHFAALVKQRSLGLTVPPGDVEALATAIGRLLDDDALRGRCRENLRAIASEMRWDVVSEPLRRFVANPRFAADRAPAMRGLRERLRRSYRWSKLVKRAVFGLGVSEARWERLKQTSLVRAGLGARNRIAVARARRAAIVRQRHG